MATAAQLEKDIKKFKASLAKSSTSDTQKKIISAALAKAEAELLTKGAKADTKKASSTIKKYKEAPAKSAKKVAAKKKVEPSIDALRKDIEEMKAVMNAKGTSDATKNTLKKSIEGLEKKIGSLSAVKNDVVAPAPKKAKKKAVKKTSTPKKAPAVKKAAKKKETIKSLVKSKASRKTLFSKYAHASDDSLERDAKRSARNFGKRVSATGNIYYEYRANRFDVKQGKRRKYPLLAHGGEVMGLAELKASAKSYNTERDENVLGFESAWDKSNNYLPVVYFVSDPTDDLGMRGVYTGILDNGILHNIVEAYDGVIDTEEQAYQIAHEFAAHEEHAEPAYEKGGEIGDKIAWKFNTGENSHVIHTGFVIGKEGIAIQVKEDSTGVKYFINESDICKYPKFEKDGTVGEVIVLEAPATDIGYTNVKHRYVLTVADPALKSILKVQQQFKSGEWGSTGGGWYVGTLLNADGYHGNNQNSDVIVIDGGSNWRVGGLTAALEEVKGILDLDTYAKGGVIDKHKVGEKKHTVKSETSTNMVYHICEYDKGGDKEGYVVLVEFSGYPSRAVDRIFPTEEAAKNDALNRSVMEEGGQLPDDIEEVEGEEVIINEEEKPLILEEPETMFAEPASTENADIVVPPHFNSGENIDVFGYKTQNFDVCGIASEQFEQAMDDILSNKENDYYNNPLKENLATLAQYVDAIFGLEKAVVYKNSATAEEIYLMTLQIELVGVYNMRSGLKIDASFLGTHVYEITTRVKNSISDVSVPSINIDNKINNFDEHAFLSMLFPEVSDTLLVDHGLILNPANWSITDGGTVTYYPSKMLVTIKEGGQEVVDQYTISYTNEEENLIGEIKIDLASREVKIKFMDNEGVMQRDSIAYESGGEIRKKNQLKECNAQFYSYNPPHQHGVKDFAILPYGGAFIKNEQTGEYCKLNDSDAIYDVQDLKDRIWEDPAFLKNKKEVVELDEDEVAKRVLEDNGYTAMTATNVVFFEDKPNMLIGTLGSNSEDTAIVFITGGKQNPDNQDLGYLIDKKQLREILDTYPKGERIHIFTNAGVELHSKELRQDEWKNLKIHKIGEGYTYEKGGSLFKYDKGEKVKVKLTKDTDGTDGEIEGVIVERSSGKSQLVEYVVDGHTVQKYKDDGATLFKIELPYIATTKDVTSIDDLQDIVPEYYKIDGQRIVISSNIGKRVYEWKGDKKDGKLVRSAEEYKGGGRTIGYKIIFENSDNSVIVRNQMQELHGEYKKIAEISEDGDVKYNVVQDSLPEHIQHKISQEADLVKKYGLVTTPAEFKKGGTIPDGYNGKSAEQIWEMWDESQRKHFLHDHRASYEIKGENIWLNDFNDLPADVRQAINYHRHEGQYKHGGMIADETPYLPSIIADKVAFELVDKNYPTHKDEEAVVYANTLAKYLEEKAEKEYRKPNSDFKHKIGKGSNIGRDRFYEILGEWGEVWVETHSFEEVVEANMATEFKNGGTVEHMGKFKKVMGEFEAGKLIDSHGNTITKRNQALAIAYAEARGAGEIREKGGETENNSGSKLVLVAKTKGGKYEIRINKGSDGSYEVEEFTKGSSRVFGSYNSKENMEKALNYTLDGSSKIDGINYEVTQNDDNINILTIKKDEPALSRSMIEERLGYEKKENGGAVKGQKYKVKFEGPEGLPMSAEMTETEIKSYLKKHKQSTLKAKIILDKYKGGGEIDTTRTKNKTTAKAKSKKDILSKYK